MKYPIKHRASREGYDWPIRWEHERDSDRSAKRRNTEGWSGPKGKSAGRNGIARELSA